MVVKRLEAHSLSRIMRRRVVWVAMAVGPTALKRNRLTPPSGWWQAVGQGDGGTWATCPTSPDFSSQSGSHRVPKTERTSPTAQVLLNLSRFHSIQSKSCDKAQAWGGGVAGRCQSECMQEEGSNCGHVTMVTQGRLSFTNTRTYRNIKTTSSFPDL